MGASKTIRQSVTMPSSIAVQVRSMARSRKLSANKMILELIENGIEAERRRQERFFELAEKFRKASEPAEIKRLGEELGSMVFGG